MAGTGSAPRAIGIVRVSRTNKREGDQFASPHVQRERIEDSCEREGLQLLEVLEELDVSGGKPLEQRTGLGPAVRAVEEGRADVIVGAYFDRLFRNTLVQAQVVQRVEAAGGRVLAVDVGSVSTKSAGQWLSSTLLGAVAEYHRRTTAERVQGAIERAIRRGVAPYGRVTAGYRKREDGVYEPDPATAPVVAEAFAMRAREATVNEVWQYLTRNGIEITYGGAYALLSSRVVLGEIHFGKFEPNLHAHPAIVGRDTWNAVQKARVPSGRKAKSELLLARLGVLRCGTCDSRMAGSTARGSTSAGGGGGKVYPIYRCGNKTCPRPVSISVRRVDEPVAAVVRSIHANAKGRASMAAKGRAIAAEAEQAQSELDAGIRVLAIVGNEPAAIARLVELQANRDEKFAARDELGGDFEESESIDIAERWDDLTLDERRRAIKRTLARVVVAPGRGAGRLDYEPLLQ